MQLIIGDKSYGSWSMRPWVLMRHFGIPFDETPIELRTPETSAPIRAVSPSGKVLCLIDDDGLAIAETLAESHPALAMWPAEPAACRPEMHAGFVALCAEMPLDIRDTLPG